MKKITARLETVAELYDIPLWTLRKWASRGEFPGIIRKKGGRRIYVDLEKFREWWLGTSTERKKNES